ncbi:MAG: SpoIID/LytB domain-containing protein [Limnoraphis sp. WC205]|jgi:SpoIID/LytB domain protein|nr:SpoIID/LytB domain-containing protein [Limnoraphis sp. WC205]
MIIPTSSFTSPRVCQHSLTVYPFSFISLSQVIVSIFVLAVTPAQANTQQEFNPTLEVGVVQQFGKKPTDTLILKAKPDDHLTLRFQSEEGEKVLQTLSVILKIETQSLAEPLVDERIVLSSHRSYETAEEEAQKWREMGIEVELAQPDLWQVWAKRSVYNTPLLRRWLLESIKAQGHQKVRLQTQVLKQQRVPYWVLGGFRYNRHELLLSATQNVIEVHKSSKDPQPMSYGGSLELQPDAYGTYTLVNHVPLETYLRGVVPHEMGAWPPDASIEAQAILSRTYALRNLRRFEADNYQICANTDCQVYKGLTEVYPSTDRGVAVTEGLVLTYNNQLADAVYFSLSGGVTANFHDIWDGPERSYLRPVVDAQGQVWDLSANSLADEQNFRRFMSLQKGFNEEGWVDFRWREATSLKAMTAHLKYYLERKYSIKPDFQTIKQVKVTQRSPSGRVLQMEVQTEKETIKIEKDEIQNAFWPPVSTLFYIDPIYDKDQKLDGYLFVGGGFGHGVGLSQTGSYKLSELGWSSDRILQFYFPGTELKRLSESVAFWQPLQMIENESRVIRD